MITIKNNNVTSTEGKYVRRKGKTDCLGLHQMQALEGDTVESFEEYDEMPPYTAEQYERKVEELIALKYSDGAEKAIQRQRDTKPEEFKAYFDYCEQCKQRAKEELTGKIDN